MGEAGLAARFPLGPVANASRPETRFDRSFALIRGARVRDAPVREPTQQREPPAGRLRLRVARQAWKPLPPATARTAWCTAVHPDPRTLLFSLPLLAETPEPCSLSGLPAAIGTHARCSGLPPTARTRALPGRSSGVCRSPLDFV